MVSIDLNELERTAKAALDESDSPALLKPSTVLELIERVRIAEQNHVLYRPELEAANAKLLSVAEVARHVRCGCSPNQIVSGHKVDCWMPELNHVLAALDAKACDK